jgi:hypothetical protein
MALLVVDAKFNIYETVLITVNGFSRKGTITGIEFYTYAITDTDGRNSRVVSMVEYKVKLSSEDSSKAEFYSRETKDITKID